MSINDSRKSLESGKIWRLNKDNKYICDGDCQSWSFSGICTCGLYHALRWLEDGLSQLDGHSNKFRRRQRETLKFIEENYNKIPVVTTCSHNIDLDEKCTKCIKEIEKLIQNIIKSHT